MKSSSIPARTLSFLLCLVSSMRGDSIPQQWEALQEIRIQEPGPVRWSLPLETLDHCQSQLQDLRLFDSENHPVSFLLEIPQPSPIHSLHPKSMKVALRQKQTRILLETGSNRKIDRITLGTQARDFIKAVSIRGSQNETQWVDLAVDQPIYALPGGTRQTTVPILSGSWRHLEIVVQDERSLPVPFPDILLHPSEPESAPIDSVPVPILEQEEREGLSRYTLDLGGAHIHLQSLQIETEEPLFSRQATLSIRAPHDQWVSENVLSHGVILREKLSKRHPPVAFPVHQLIPDRKVVLTIINQDNPPIKIARITAIRRPIQMIFIAKSSGTFRIASGNPDAKAPQYDLPSLRNSFGKLPLSSIRVMPLILRPDYQPSDPLGGMILQGSPLDVTKWKYRKKLTPSDAHYLDLTFDGDVLANTSPDYRDIRLVRDGKQYPYLLDVNFRTQTRECPLEKMDEPGRPHRSQWKIDLPFAVSIYSFFTFRIQNSLFNRQVTLYEILSTVQSSRQKNILGEARWKNESPDLNHPIREASLSLKARPQSSHLQIEIENGDNAELVIQNATLTYPLSRIIFQNPGTDTYLYYGNPHIAPPQYDLELVSEKLFRAKRTSGSLQSQESVPSNPKTLLEITGTQGKSLFWVVLGLVVVILLYLIHRMLPPGNTPTS